MTRGWIVADLLAALVFICCAGLQLNDPDPLIWIPVYIVPAALSLIAVRWRMHPVAPAAAACAYAAGAALLWWAGIEQSHVMPGFPQAGALGEERVREGLGLVLVTIWMTILALRSARAISRTDD